MGGSVIGGSTVCQYLDIAHFTLLHSIFWYIAIPLMLLHATILNIVLWFKYVLTENL